MSLSDRELERYARHIVLPQVGGIGQLRLKQARVAMIGAGAIGAAVLPALAGAGVGALTVIDDDSVELSNLQRQLIFTEGDVGHSKADITAHFLRSLNSDIKTVPVIERLTADNARGLLDRHDLVIDGTDNFATRLMVNEACVSLRIPLVSAAAAQFQGQVALLRGWEEGQPCYRCFVGDAFDADDCDTCAGQGVLGALTATVGSFAALIAIRAIAGVGDDVAGKLFLFDGVNLNWRSMNLPKDRGCRTCAAGIASP